MNSNEELSAIGVASPTPVNPRDSERRVQPRQTDAVDQFVAREANGYIAEPEGRRGLLERKSFLTAQVCLGCIRRSE